MVTWDNMAAQGTQAANGYRAQESIALLSQAWSVSLILQEKPHSLPQFALVKLKTQQSQEKTELRFYYKKSQRCQCWEKKLL